MRGIRTMLRPFFFSVVRIVLLAYLGFGAALFFFQRDFLYFPSEQQFGACEDLADAEAMTLPDGARAYFLPVSDERVAVMYHGNAGSACDRALYAQFFKSVGYSALIVEYAGYGNDPRGGPSAERILGDAAELASFIESQKFDTVVLVGKSIGASVASYHASLHEPDALVLINPMMSATKRAQELHPIYPASLLLRERYDTLAWASHAPGTTVALIHAGADTIIPSHHSRELYEELPQAEKTLTIIEGADHNTLIAFPAFWAAFERVFDR